MWAFAQDEVDGPRRKMEEDSAKKSAHDVAKFMAEELGRVKWLDQEAVVQQIIKKFGREFTVTNSNGNPSINKDVLRAFNKLTPDTVWSRGEKHWRARLSTDKQGRQQ
jgi:hypothetical protein